MREERPDPRVLFEIARWRMPFGRFAGRRLIDLPEPYVVWWRDQGQPRGRLGVLFETLFDIKANGLEPLLAPYRDRDDPLYRPAPTGAVAGLEEPALGRPPSRAPDRERDPDD